MGRPCTGSRVSSATDAPMLGRQRLAKVGPGALTAVALATPRSWSQPCSRNLQAHVSHFTSRGAFEEKAFRTGLPAADSIFQLVQSCPMARTIRHSLHDLSAHVGRVFDCPLNVRQSASSTRVTEPTIPSWIRVTDLMINPREDGCSNMSMHEGFVIWIQLGLSQRYAEIEERRWQYSSCQVETNEG